MNREETAEKAKALATELTKLNTELTLQKFITQFDACVEAYQALQAYAAKQDEKIDRLTRCYDKWLTKQDDKDVDVLVAELEKIGDARYMGLSILAEDIKHTGGDITHLRESMIQARYELQRDIAIARFNHPKS